jgi:hypothetical protein
MGEGVARMLGWAGGCGVARSGRRAGRGQVSLRTHREGTDRRRGTARSVIPEPVQVRRDRTPGSGGARGSGRGGSERAIRRRAGLRPLPPRPGQLPDALRDRGAPLRGRAGGVGGRRPGQRRRGGRSGALPVGEAVVTVDGAGSWTTTSTSAGGSGTRRRAAGTPGPGNAGGSRSRSRNGSCTKTRRSASCPRSSGKRSRLAGRRFGGTGQKGEAALASRETRVAGTRTSRPTSCRAPWCAVSVAPPSPR